MTEGRQQKTPVTAFTFFTLIIFVFFNFVIFVLICKERHWTPTYFTMSCILHIDRSCEIARAKKLISSQYCKHGHIWQCLSKHLWNKLN